MRNIKLYSAVFTVIYASGLAYAEPQVTGKITHESAQFISTGNPVVSSTAHGKDTFKSETSARVYVDGELESLPNGGSYHIELQGYYNGDAIDEHDDNEEYTQREFLREAYIDTSSDDWELRIGKQQVVWGTADGAKLLDIINPTDYTEMAQNQMEDSRIPIWMLNAATETSNGGNLQFIVSESRSNVMAGLGDSSSSRGGSGTAAAGTTTTVATLAMKEKLDKVLNIGGSFDKTIETDSFGPVVLRGEAVYQKGVMKPVIVRKDSTGRDLTHGFLVSSVKMQEADMFKYVLGIDITALTNMMISTQFIQERNLDFIDTGNKDSTNWKYTADMASMHVTNNLLKGEENKEFMSLFLSKPFGESGQHRWNNITMLEDTGGRWNRFDVEYTINDNTIGTLELNKYWGDDNSQFGQLKKQSNVQVGVKYTF